MRAIVPYDLIRCGPPLQPRPLLPVPGCRLPDLGPFVPVSEIDKTNIPTIGRLNSPVLKINSHPQQVASRGIELQTLVKEKPGIGLLAVRPRIRDTDEGRIARIA